MKKALYLLIFFYRNHLTLQQGIFSKTFFLLKQIILYQICYNFLIYKTTNFIIYKQTIYKIYNLYYLHEFAYKTLHFILPFGHLILLVNLQGVMVRAHSGKLAMVFVDLPKVNIDSFWSTLEFGLRSFCLLYITYH